MKYSKSFMREVIRFEQCSNQEDIEKYRSNQGLKQFFDYESHGIRPEKPDLYFKILCSGKIWWEWTLNFMAESYCTYHWDGWLMKAMDFRGDSFGFKQLRARCGCSQISPEQLIESCLLPCEMYLGLGI